MRYLRILILLPLLAACTATGSQAQRVLESCEAHDAAIRVLTPRVASSELSAGQVYAMDQSIAIADRVCTGMVPNFTVALEIIEAEVTRLLIMQGE